MSLKPAYTISQDRVQLSARIPVRVQPMHVGVPVPPHDHDYYEISIVRAGKALHRTAQGRQAIGAGSVVVIAPGDVHAFDAVAGLDVVNVYYLSEWLLAEVEGLWESEGLVRLFLARHLFGLPGGIGPYVLKADESVRSACERELADITEEIARPRPSRLVLRCAVVKLLSALGRALPVPAPGENRISFDPRVRTVIARIEERVARGQELDLAAVAMGLAVTPGHAGRLLRDAIGLSPTAYFQRRRVQRASLMLLEPGVSVTQVAHRLGFVDGAHFTRCFRAQLGVSPRQYRNGFLSGSPAGDQPNMLK